MAAPTRTPRERWLEAARERFASGGPDAVRVEALAKALGVTKGGFYGHFRDRESLLEELLDDWERASTEDVLARVERDGGAARRKLRLAGALTFSSDLLPIDLAVRDWARRDAAVAERLRRVDNVRMDFLRTQFATFCPDEAEVEARSTLAFCLMIGHHFMAADHGDRTRSEALDLAARTLGASLGVAAGHHRSATPAAGSTSPTQRRSTPAPGPDGSRSTNDVVSEPETR